MGNYFEGTLRFGFNNDPNDELFNDLNLLNKGVRDKEKYSKTMQESEWFKHERWDYPGFDLDGCWKNKNDETDFFYLNVDSEKELEKDDMKCFEKVCYILTVNFCMKGYRKNGDLGEMIVDYFRPYCDEELYNPENTYIGTIQDENSTYSRDFYLDKSHMKILDEKKEYTINMICPECPKNNYVGIEFCRQWKDCLRAYELGKREIGESNEI